MFSTKLRRLFSTEHEEAAARYRLYNTILVRSALRRRP
jgi:hypothetical protein